MTFAAPLFLAAALAGIIPVVLHMVNRQKARELPFSTLRFLKISVQKTRRKRRVHDLLLMLLRALLLVLIAFGLAGPALTQLGSLWGGGSSAIVIVLDNSASMGTVDDRQMRMDIARGAARQILGQLEEGDAVALLVTGGTKFPEQGRLDRSHGKVRQMLDQVRVSYERAELGGAIAAARKLLAKAEDANKQIYVITDLQKHAWDGLVKQRSASAANANAGKGEKTERIPIILVDCHQTPKPNVAVADVSLDAAVPVAGMAASVIVDLFNAATVEQQPHLEVYLDGQQQTTTPAVRVPPGAHRRETISLEPLREGLHEVEIRLAGEDGSTFDDRRFLAMEVGRAIPVAIVKWRRHEIPYLDDTFYLEQALAPAESDAWPIAARAMTAAELADGQLSDYAAIFCVNLPAPNAQLAGRLRDYVAGGGNIVWICGDQVDPAAYNRIDRQAQPPLLPATLMEMREPQPGDDRDSWNIGLLDKEHPALTEVAEPASLYQSVLVYKHVRIAAEDVGGVRVLARLDDGEPLLVERNVGQGRVLLLGTSVHVGWTNLPLRKIFLPLFARLTFDLASAETTRRETLAGSPLLIPLDDTSRSSGIQITTPGGESIRPKLDKESTYRYQDTHRIGTYRIRSLSGGPPIGFAVNADPEESDPATITPGELKKLLGRTPLVLADDPNDLSHTFAQLRQGRSLWNWLLGAVLVGLVIETFVSNRLTMKQEGGVSREPLPARFGHRG